MSERRCEHCDLVLPPARGRPRRFCRACLPPVGEIGQAAYNKRYDALLPKTERRTRWQESAAKRKRNKLEGVVPTCDNCGSTEGVSRRRFCGKCLPPPSEIGWPEYQKRFRELRREHFEEVYRRAREANAARRAAARANDLCECGCGRTLQGRTISAKYFDRRCERAAKFGISSADWDSMFEAQGRRCASCGTTDPSHKWATDHCHRTGIVRGILCMACNTSLGQMGESPERILGLYTYCTIHAQVC